MGIALIVIGALCLTAGIWMQMNQGTEVPLRHEPKSQQLEHVIDSVLTDGVFTPNERELVVQTAVKLGEDPEEAVQRAEDLLKNGNKKPETEIIDENVKNGLDFEKYVLKLFSKKYFNLKDWTGDKFVDGIYSDKNQNPDLHMSFKLREVEDEFAVECKFRSKFFKGGVDVGSDEQIARYQQFEKDMGMPVFIAIGVGGTGNNPEQIFVVPVREAKSRFISKDMLKKYEIKNRSRGLYYDYKTKMLN